MAHSALDTQSVVDGYMEACATRGLARGTLYHRRTYLQHFLQWVGERDIGDLTSEDIRAYAVELAAYRYKRSKAESAMWKPLERRTQAQRLWLVTDLLEYMARRRFIFANPASGISPKMPPRPLPKRIPTESEMTRILATPNTLTSIGRRDRAILELMYSTGLRVEEVTKLDVQDLDLSTGTVTVRCGKGGKGRVVPIGEAAVSALLDYLQHTRPGFAQAPGCAALFLASDQHGFTGHRHTTESIRDRLHKIARKAAIDRTITPHQIRHACATHMLRAGCDLRHIQQLLGHARIDTTEIYTQVEVSDLSDVLDRTHPRARTAAAKEESKKPRG
ncbi:MAG: tyrosine-type recombinase/integrase [Pseudomonadota bacterium]